MPGTRTRAGLLVAAISLAAGLSGCGVGTDATTLQVRKVVDGQEKDAGDLRLRNVYLQAPAGTEWVTGSDVPLSMYVVNTGSESDALLGGSAGDLGTLTITPAPLAIAAHGLLPLGAAYKTAADTAPSPQPGISASKVMISGITQALRTGSTVRLQLTFQRAGIVTLDVPVALAD